MEPLQPLVATPLVDFAGLYRAHARHVHRFAVDLSGDPALADDLVSGASVRVWTARARVDLTTVRAYLFAIVRNLFRQDMARARRRVPLDERLASRHRARKTARRIRAACGRCWRHSTRCPRSTGPPS